MGCGVGRGVAYRFRARGLDVRALAKPGFASCCCSESQSPVSSSEELNARSRDRSQCGDWVPGETLSALGATLIGS